MSGGLVQIQTIDRYDISLASIEEDELQGIGASVIGSSDTAVAIKSRTYASPAAME
jgi:hypothetical protein